MKLFGQKGVTLIELVVVVLILSILSTIAVGVYTKEVMRAKIVRTRAEIRTLEVAAHRYQIDTGQFPPSGTGTAIAPSNLDPSVPYAGSGYLNLALRASLNGDSLNPLSSYWLGPYLDWDENRLGTLTGTPITSGLSKAQIQFLDPFGNPYYYIRSEEYDAFEGTFLPSSSPYFATETYYNPATFQIISFGPNETSIFSPSNALGTDGDDLTNFESPSF